MASQIEINRRTGERIEGYGLIVSRAEVSIDQIIVPDDLWEQFPEENDPAVIEGHKEILQSPIASRYAIVVKEVISDDPSHPTYELVHKPALVKAMQTLDKQNADVLIIHDSHGIDFHDFSFEQYAWLGEQGAKIDHIVRHIPLDMVTSEGSITDDKRVNDLLREIKRDGQKVNVWLRPKLINGKVYCDIIDGFHRTRVRIKQGALTIWARLSFGMTDEELFDHRVRAAADVEAVKFARVVKLMRQSFEESKWYKVYNLTLAQLLHMGSNTTTDHPGKNIGLNVKELSTEAVTWITEKANVWGLYVGSINQMIMAADRSFPEIIEQVRSSGGGGHAGDGVLNNAKFIAMVDIIPENLDLQRIVAVIIKEHNINSDDTTLVCRALLKAHNKKDLETIQQLRQEPRDVAKEYLKDEALEEERQVQDAEAVLYVQPTAPNAKTSNVSPTITPNIPEKKTVMTPGHNRRLFSAGAEKQAPSPASMFVAPESQLPKKDATAWWMMKELSLSDDEQQIMIMLNDGVSIDDIPDKLQLSPNKFNQLWRSANQKHALYVDSQRIVKKFRRNV
jgi:hypothetical protein